MTQHEIAVQCLKKLNIYKPYIKRFEKDFTPTFFEKFAGFYADQEPELWEKIKEIQKEHKVMVYAVTHELSEFGECWDMLCVSSSDKKLEDCLQECSGNIHYAFAYVWNKTCPSWSEFGDIVVKDFGGGIIRIG